MCTCCSDCLCLRAGKVSQHVRFPFLAILQRAPVTALQVAHAGSICVGALLPGLATSLLMMRPKAHAAFSF
jgi:hypothetical protein